jgi:glycosyltransferase involved in cell wall biosynthesis
VLSYEFPPSGGGGVQRIAKFARDLRSFGWEPVVISAEHVPGRPWDETLVEDVEGIPVTRLPHRNTMYAVARPLVAVKGLLRRRGGAGPTTGSGAGVGAAIGMPLSTRIVRWACIPDEARRWARSVVRHVRASGEAYDVVLASGPPHSTLVAGRECAEALGIPLVADMRDAWATNPHFLQPTPLHRALALAAERRVCESTAIVTAVSSDIVREAERLGARRAVVIPNGYDALEMPTLAGTVGMPLVLAFMGRFYTGSDPTPLLDALRSVLAQVDPGDIRFEVVGESAPAVQEAVRVRDLESKVRFHGYLPHREALAVIAAADVGVVVIADVPGARSVYSGKLFEYLGMGLPVLLIGPVDGAAADLVRSTGAGRVVSHSDVNGIAQALRELCAAKSRGEALASPDREQIASFERRGLARTLADLLDEATDKDAR